VSSEQAASSATTAPAAASHDQRDQAAPRVSIIVPTYREVENIPLLVPRITESLQARDLTHEIIIVDDNSDDGSREAVDSLQQAGHAVRIIVRQDERGLSSAVLRGFDEAKGMFLVCMDADLSHPPERVPEMVTALADDGMEFVIGSRYVKGGGTDASWGFFRWLNSRIATLLALPFCRVKDPMAGFFALPREVYQRAQALNPIGYKIGLELIVKCDCKRIHEVPIYFADRQHGQSKLNWREQANYVRHLKRLADHKFGGWSQLGQFCLVGASGLVVDLMLYALLLYLGVTISLARAIGIFTAMTWNFAINRRFSFSTTRFGRPIIGQYLRYVASTSFGAVVSWSVAVGLSSFTAFFEKHLLLAALIGIAAGTLANFGLARNWVFTDNRDDEPEPEQTSV